MQTSLHQTSNPQAKGMKYLSALWLWNFLWQTIPLPVKKGTHRAKILLIQFQLPWEGYFEISHHGLADIIPLILVALLTQQNTGLRSLASGKVV